MNMQLHPGTPKEAGLSAERVRHIAHLAEGWVAEGIHPALVILVARKGKIVLHEAFGHLAPEPEAPPLARDTIFPLASLTKPITATAVMMLLEDGLLGLNRPVAEYLPEFVGEGKEAVMVHHLLTHTSGLRDEEVKEHAEKKKDSVEIPPPEETQHPTIHEYLFLRHDAPLWKPPGEEMSYCPYGYELLGEIVRRVSGLSLADFARARIFAPLGMKDTDYIVPESVQHRIVRRPPDAPGSFYDTQEMQERPWGGGGVYSTAMDIAIFGQMFLNGGIYGDTRILSPVSVTEMTRNQIPGISAWLDAGVHGVHDEEFFPEASWGLGWDIMGNKKSPDDGTLCSPEAFQHGGFGGVRMWVDPTYETVGVYFSVVLSEAINEFGCVDLFMNAVTAAIVDA